MIFHKTTLPGAFVIEAKKLPDDRGFFARSWCVNEFKAQGLNSRLVQCNISYNKKKLTLRGMHYQISPFAEAKVVRCTRGAIYDVIIDIRRTSATRTQWIGVELNDRNRNMLYVPEGFAHGFLTLENDTEVFYQMSEFYSPDHARTIRWNDPLFNVNWPSRPRVMSTKDEEVPDCILENLGE